jgi:hypothetical protein
MTEDEFWSRLEYRLCDEFRGMTEGGLSEYWCDGFSAAAYSHDEIEPKIIGNVWIVKGSDEQEWKFELILPKQFAAPAIIDWASVLPPDDVTRWLSVDRQRHRIKIEPATAVRDLKMGK